MSLIRKKSKLSQTGLTSSDVSEGDGRSGSFERILFSRVEFWVVVLLLLLGCLFAIGLAGAALDAERKERQNCFSRAALAIAEIPQNLKTMWGPDIRLRAWGTYRHDAKPRGWILPSGPMTSPSGYILLSRYDGTEKRSKIDLVSLPRMETIYSWTPDAQQLLKGVTHISRFADTSAWDRVHFRQIHPWLTDNGDLIVKDQASPLIRVNPCGKVIWTLQDPIFHHSTETDADGNLWIPSTTDHQSIASVGHMFQENMLTKVNPSGKVLFNRSVPQILIRHGYANWLFTNGMYNDDPTHLNDIQPVLADGPYWHKGDLFVSMRNVSAIMLYRPSTDQIIWMRRGPWISQHDVDIIDDHRIGVFNNNAEERPRATPFFEGTSQVIVYDFATDRFSIPFEAVMKKSNVRAWVEGLFTMLPDGSMMVEDSNDGRLLILRPDGSISAEFANRAEDGWSYRLDWSRYIDKTKGDVVVSNLRKMRCSA